MKVTIDKLNYMGKGICRYNNKVMFVPYTLPKDEVLVTTFKESKRYDDARVVKFIKKSDSHIKPLCPYYERCGGCNYMHTSYESELDFKLNNIREIFNNNGFYPEIMEITSGERFYYRNKVTLNVTSNKLCYFMEKSHEAVFISECVLCDHKINDIIKVLLSIDLSNVLRVTIRNFVNSMVIFEVRDDVNLDISKLSLVDNVLIKNGENYKVVKNDSYLISRISDFTFHVEKDSFFQVNKFLTAKLYDKILDFLEPSTEDSVLDLYCGSGSIGIYVSRMVHDVIGVEINRESIKSANINKEINGISNISFINGDVSKVINDVRKVDKVIVDPPRSGLDKNTIDNLIRLRPQRIVYVSCNIHSLVKNLKDLSKYYDVIKVNPVDMFACSYHLECVSLLQRKDFEK